MGNDLKPTVTTNPAPSEVGDMHFPSCATTEASSGTVLNSVVPEGCDEFITVQTLPGAQITRLKIDYQQDQHTIARRWLHLENPVQVGTYWLTKKCSIPRNNNPDDLDSPYNLVLEGNGTIRGYLDKPAKIHDAWFMKSADVTLTPEGKIVSVSGRLVPEEQGGTGWKIAATFIPAGFHVEAQWDEKGNLTSFQARDLGHGENPPITLSGIPNSFP